MKKLLLSLTLLVGVAVHVAAEPTAKAIYCAANTTLYFTYDEVTYNTTTAYEQLDGNTPTKVYDNISPTGYLTWPGVVTNVSGPITIGEPQANSTPWSQDYRKDITTVKILNNFSAWEPTALNGYFFYLEKLSTIIGGNNLNTSEVNSLTATFTCCYSLTNLNFLSDWDVSKLTSMDATFQGCRALSNIDGLAGWDVSNVTLLNKVFWVCDALTNVDALANWDVSNVQTMELTFANCASLTDIDGLKRWNVSSVKDMTALFENCPFTNVDALADWQTDNVVFMIQVFEGCSNLTNIDGLSEWNTNTVVDMEQLFIGTAITDVAALENWDVSNVTNFKFLFSLCSQLEDLEGLRNWNVEKVGCMTSAFSKCSSLTSLEPIENWKTSSLCNLEATFYFCTGLTRIDLSKWDLSNISKTWHIWNTTEINNNGSISTQGHQADGARPLNLTFTGCSNLIGITFGKGNIGKELLDASNNRNGTFSLCPKLRFIDLSYCTDEFGNFVSVDRSKGNKIPWSGGIDVSNADAFFDVPRTCVIYLPQGNGQPTEGDLENVVYTASDNTLQCDKYYSEDKVDIELPHRFHADLATYERPFSKTYAGVILPYPVKINDNASDEFQPFILQEEYVEQMFFKGSDNVPANTPFVFKRKGSTNMKFAMEDVWVESTYDVNGETSDNIDPEFRAWKSQGFYVTHEIEPENGVFNIPTMDDYVGTETVAYEPNKVYYIASNKFYRTDPSTLYLDPHRILYYGQWEKFSGDITGARPAVFTIEELDGNSPAITAIQEAELRLDESRAAAIYDASGNRLSETKRGVNILRMADGSVKKVLRK